MADDVYIERDGQWEHIGTAPTLSTNDDTIVGDNGEAIGPTRVARTGTVEFTLQADVAESLRAEVRAAQELVRRNNERRAAQLPPVLAQIRARANELFVRNQHHGKRVIVTASQWQTITEAADLGPGVNVPDARLYGLPVEVRADDSPVARHLPIIIGEHDTLTRFVLSNAALVASSLAVAGTAMQQSFRAVMHAADMAARSMELFTINVRRRTRCVRCVDRDANERRVDPDLCDDCNDRRFWLVAGSLLFLMAMLAVGLIIGGKL